MIAQPPRSPDFNILDAGIFAYLERRQQEQDALTMDEIRESVAISYDELTDVSESVHVPSQFCAGSQSYAARSLLFRFRGLCPSPHARARKTTEIL